MLLAQVYSETTENFPVVNVTFSFIGGNGIPPAGPPLSTQAVITSGPSNVIPIQIANQRYDIKLTATGYSFTPKPKHHGDKLTLPNTMIEEISKEFARQLHGHISIRVRLRHSWMAAGSIITMIINTSCMAEAMGSISLV